jgi:hypothetical protein
MTSALGGRLFQIARRAHLPGDARLLQIVF